ncbi:MAG TPA: hypothetical protein P5102_10480 [Candidatus Competibacteraceae bacterium]|nr:hypothetical protein [Candidatus Competibacteraceae bacterium]HRZ06557.1 hypothetical protein [Candidatus Competibacteraceae bacterium]HSA46865.1 hypothetical protein [Candidatus Competibacteraceae bacterium]
MTVESSPRLHASGYDAHVEAPKKVDHSTTGAMTLRACTGCCPQILSIYRG